MNETTTPLESALAWVVKWEPHDRHFIGMGALLSQQQQGLNRKLVGLTLQDKGIMRTGQRVVIDGHPDGVITSGTYSPTLTKSIALARVPMETGPEVMIDIRGKLYPATVGKPRFVKNGQAI
jgi:aminomethyltransferase